MIMVKISTGAEQREGVAAIADIFRAKVVDVSKDSLVIELTGSKNKLEAFIELLEPYEILELARTGIVGLSRGAENVTFL